MHESLLTVHRHSLKAADKSGQRPMTAVGCPNAESQLVAALKAWGKFVNQEQLALLRSWLVTSESGIKSRWLYLAPENHPEFPRGYLVYVRPWPKYDVRHIECLLSVIP